MSMTDIFLPSQLLAWQGGRVQVVREGWARPQDRLEGSRVCGEVEVETWCFGVDLAEVRGEEE